MFYVYVILQNEGIGKQIYIDVEEEVSDFKVKIEKLLGVPVYKQRLIYRRNRQIEDGNYMAAFDLKSSEIIVLLSRTYGFSRVNEAETYSSVTRTRLQENEEVGTSCVTVKESDYYRVGDMVDFLDQLAGCWYEGKITKIYVDAEDPRLTKFENGEPSIKICSDKVSGCVEISEMNFAFEVENFSKTWCVHLENINEFCELYNSTNNDSLRCNNHILRNLSNDKVKCPNKSRFVKKKHFKSTTPKSKKTEVPITLNEHGSKNYKRSTNKKKSGLQDNDNRIGISDNCTYKVENLSYFSEPHSYCELYHVRPRARNLLSLEELREGQIVMVNYNLHDPEEVGLWFDAKVIKIINTADEKFVIVDLLRRPHRNVKIWMTEHIYEIEESTLLLNRNEQNILKDLKRPTTIICELCRDSETKSCKKCGCCVCGGKPNCGKMILCDSDNCITVIHLTCCRPPLTELPDEWYCDSCDLEEEESEHSESDFEMEHKEIRQPIHKSTKNNSTISNTISKSSITHQKKSNGTPKPNKKSTDENRSIQPTISNPKIICPSDVCNSPKEEESEQSESDFEIEHKDIRPSIHTSKNNSTISKTISKSSSTHQKKSNGTRKPNRKSTVKNRSIQPTISNPKIICPSDVCNSPKEEESEQSESDFEIEHKDIRPPIHTSKNNSTISKTISKSSSTHQKKSNGTPKPNKKSTDEKRSIQPTISNPKIICPSDVCNSPKEEESEQSESDFEMEHKEIRQLIHKSTKNNSTILNTISKSSITHQKKSNGTPKPNKKSTDENRSIQRTISNPKIICPSDVCYSPKEEESEQSESDYEIEHKEIRQSINKSTKNNSTIVNSISKSSITHPKKSNGTPKPNKKSTDEKRSTQPTISNPKIICPSDVCNSPKEEESEQSDSDFEMEHKEIRQNRSTKNNSTISNTISKTTITHQKKSNGTGNPNRKSTDKNRSIQPTISNPKIICPSDVCNSPEEEESKQSESDFEMEHNEIRQPIYRSTKNNSSISNTISKSSITHQKKSNGTGKPNRKSTNENPSIQPTISNPKIIGPSDVCNSPKEEESKQSESDFEMKHKEIRQPNHRSTKNNSSISKTISKSSSTHQKKSNGTPKPNKKSTDENRSTQPTISNPKIICTSGVRNSAEEEESEQSESDFEMEHNEIRQPIYRSTKNNSSISKTISKSSSTHQKKSNGTRKPNRKSTDKNQSIQTTISNPKIICPSDVCNSPEEEESEQSESDFEMEHNEIRQPIYRSTKNNSSISNTISKSSITHQKKSNGTGKPNRKSTNENPSIQPTISNPKIIGPSDVCNSPKEEESKQSESDFEMKHKEIRQPNHRSTKNNSSISNTISKSSITHQNKSNGTGKPNKKSDINRSDNTSLEIDSCVFGPIPGISVGTVWHSRVQAAKAGVHRMFVSGIHGKKNIGAFSIILSHGYENDDQGNVFWYIGSGKDEDQELTGLNRCLALNCNAPVDDEKGAESTDWKQGKPVRVLRSFKGAKTSKFAPKEGVRYDGIYKVVKYKRVKGASGFKIWKFFMQRDDETPPPWDNVSLLTSEPTS